MQESDEGGDGVLEKCIEEGGWGKDGRRFAEKGHSCMEGKVYLDVDAERQRW